LAILACRVIAARTGAPVSPMTESRDDLENARQ